MRTKKPLADVESAGGESAGGAPWLISRATNFPAQSLCPNFEDKQPPAGGVVESAGAPWFKQPPAGGVVESAGAPWFLLARTNTMQRGFSTWMSLDANRQPPACVGPEAVVSADAAAEPGMMCQDNSPAESMMDTPASGG